jgi:hypothetical protein
MGPRRSARTSSVSALRELIDTSPLHSARRIGLGPRRRMQGCPQQHRQNDSEAKDAFQGKTAAELLREEVPGPTTTFETRKTCHQKLTVNETLSELAMTALLRRAQPSLYLNPRLERGHVPAYWAFRGLRPILPVATAPQKGSDAFESRSSKDIRLRPMYNIGGTR